jgi:uncharacterized membrane protein (UPF0182 family)
MHDDRLSYAPTFDEALQGLFEEGTRPYIKTVPQISAEEGTASDLAARANEQFDDYLRFMGENKFEQAAESLKKLKSTLEKLEQQERNQHREDSKAVPDSVKPE